MRTCVLFLTLFSASVASAATSVAPEASVSFGKDAAGYAPGAVVRPDGDHLVKEVPPATSSVEILLRLRFDRFVAEGEPFMVNVDGKNGPSVVGLRYESRYAPFRCREGEEFAFDAPWREPCIEAGVAHRSAHNADDATYGSVFANWLLVRMRLASAVHGRYATWVEADWFFSVLDSPFALTPSTAIRAGDLERVAWRASFLQRVKFGDDDEAGLEIAVLASDSGPASGVVRARYDRSFRVVIGREDGGFAIRPALGIRAEYARNFRKEAALGRDVGRLQLYLALPFGM